MSESRISETEGKTRKVLLVYTNYSPFVKADDDLMSSFSEVIHYRFLPVKGAFAILRELVRQFFYLISHFKRYDFILIWFADIQAFFPVWYGRLRKIKTAVVIGGFDAVAFPELKYGLFCSNPVRQYFGKYALRNAGFLLPVDASLIENTNRYADEKGQGLQQGIKNFVPVIRGNIIPTPTAYDPEQWKSSSDGPRKNSVVTVGSVHNWQRWYLKGGDFFQQIAREMEDTEFHFYGIADHMIRELQTENLPVNLTLHGFINIGSLPGIYSQHMVYAQFSLSEGLPNSLCEAMLCGCIPVGSEVNGIPEAIGDEQLIIRRKDVGEAVKVIRLAKEFALSGTAIYRKRIMELFPAERRLKTFHKILGSSV